MKVNKSLVAQTLCLMNVKEWCSLVIPKGAFPPQVLTILKLG